MTQVLPLVSHFDKQSAITLLESESLRFEDDIDDLVGLFDQGELIACGARSSHTLKMLVVDKNYRGGSALGEIVTSLICRNETAQSQAYFIFTKPCAVPSFERLNFRVLVRHRKAVLLENRNGINRFLRQMASQVAIGNNAAVVINADPFTLGHLSIIEAAAKESEQVYVFIPAQGQFKFGCDIRIDLARRETEHLSNVHIINAENYILSDSNFPGYFLSAKDNKDQLRMEIELALFIDHLAPYFSIKKRYVGEEPLDPVTRRHSGVMQHELSNAGIQLVEVPRGKSNDLWISTQQVKHNLAEGNIEKLQYQLPAYTFNFLQSNAEH